MHPSFAFIDIRRDRSSDSPSSFSFFSSSTFKCIMCMKIECAKCDKPTWKGCGKHIEQALKDVPAEERCQCPKDLPKMAPVEQKKPEKEEEKDQ